MNALLLAIEEYVERQMVVVFEAQAEVWRAEQRIDITGWRAANRIHKKHVGGCAAHLQLSIFLCMVV